MPDAESDATLTSTEREVLARVFGGADPSPLLVRAVERIVVARAEQIAKAIEVRAAETLPEWLWANYLDAARVARTAGRVTSPDRGQPR